MPAHLIPAQANADGIGRAIFKQAVGPGDQVGVVGVGAAVNGVTAGGGDNPHVLPAVFIAQGSQPHANDRGFATAGAGAGPPDVKHALLREHHVYGHPLVDKFLWGRRELAEEVNTFLVNGNGVVFLLNHLQGVVAQVGAGFNTLGAPLAFGRIDEDAEQPRFLPLSLGHFIELVGFGELGLHKFSFLGVFNQANFFR